MHGLLRMIELGSRVGKKFAKTVLVVIIIVVARNEVKKQSLPFAQVTKKTFLEAPSKKNAWIASHD
jgi:hypothetical protein